MPVHKILTGEGGEKYLPFALSRLRHFKIIGSGPTAQKYVFEDATVRVEWNPHNDQHFVRIDSVSGVQGYEFVTTGAEIEFEGAPLVEKRVTTLDVPKKKGKALFSNLIGETGISTSSETAHVPEGINRQANSQYFWWPIDASKDIREQIRTKDYFVTSTLGRRPGDVQFYDDQALFDYDWGAFIKDGGVRYQREGGNTDLGYDVMPTVHQSGVSARSAAPYADEPNWWRRAAVQVVDGRSFLVMTDMQSNVTVVPASYLTDPEAALFPKDKGVTVAPGSYMPAGVAVPSMATMVRPTRIAGLSWAGGTSIYPNVVGVGDSPIEDAMYEADGHPIGRGEYPGPAPGFDPDKQYQKHDYVWAFNSTGTRMVTIVHADRNNGHADLTVMDITQENKQYGTAPTRSPWRRIAQCGANMHVPALTQAAYATWLSKFDGVSGVEIFTRALLEVSINITVTGEGEDDFTVSIVPTRFIKDRWFTGADYAFRDERMTAKGVDLDDLITSELVLYTTQDEHNGLGLRRYSNAITPMNWFVPTKQYSEIVTHAYRKISNITKDSMLFNFCVLKNGNDGIEGQYVMAPLNISGLFPGYETQRHGPFSVYQVYDPGWPDTQPFVFWAYRGIANEALTIAGGTFTGLDIEDLRSLSFVFTGAITPTGRTVGMHRIVFGEVTHSDANVADILGTPLNAVLLLNKLLPARFNPPIEHRTDFGAYSPLDPSDVSTAFGLGLHRMIQLKTTHRGQSATTEAGKYASHPDGHFAHVSVSAVSSGAVKLYDQIQYRKVTKRDDGTYEQAFVETTHLDAFLKLWGDVYTEADFTTNFYDGLSDNTANTPVLARVGYWWNTKLRPHKRSGFTSMNPKFEETP